MSDQQINNSDKENLNQLAQGEVNHPEIDQPEQRKHNVSEKLDKNLDGATASNEINSNEGNEVNKKTENAYNLDIPDSTSFEESQESHAEENRDKETNLENKESPVQAKEQLNNEKPQPKTYYLKDYKEPDFYVDTINLEVDIADEATTVISTMQINRNKNNDNSTASLILDGEEQKLLAVYLDDNKVGESDYVLTKNSLTVNNVPDNFSIKIVSTCKPQDNTALSGLYKSGSMYCTQCEAQGFRRITYYPDRSDVMAKFTTTIKADKEKYPVLLSNGNLVKSGSIDNKRHFATWEDPFKKPSYLFALVAGKLVGATDTFLTMNGRLVKIELYVEQQNLDKTSHAIEALKKSMKWDEKAYGREYDLDNYIIVATDDFNMGAMENKGLNIFNSKYILARPETSTDDDFAAIDAVVGHEYFHNWSGNRVTLRDWFQLSLKEGFTVFREQQFTKYITDSPISRINDVKLLRARQFAEDSGPMAHPVQPSSYMEINNFYTLTVYEKGSEVIRMLHTLLGTKSFRKATDLYFERHDGQAVTINEFVKAMEDSSGQDLTQFKLWYSQAGTPSIIVNDKYDEHTKTYTINLQQDLPITPDQTTEKQPMHIPVKIGLINKSGNDILAKTISLTEKSQEFEFENIQEKPILSIFRDFSAPVKVVHNVGRSELAFRLKNDKDDFNRWDASQQLMNQFISNCIKKHKINSQFFLDGVLAESFRKVLLDNSIKPALKSCLMQLPTDHEIIENMEIADIDAIYSAKKFLSYELAKENKNNLLEVYYDHKTPGVYKYNSNDSAKRLLKNTALSLLMKTGDSDIFDLCQNQLYNSNNMTDEFAALTCLSNYSGREKEGILDYFYKKWKHEPLVVNKWLMLQARGEQSNTLYVVKKLMQHESFDIKNPNKVYSLIGGLASGNPLRFHDKNGKGYKFLADVIMELDSINPQVAARMINPLTALQKFDESRKEKMRKELERIYNTSGLSKDVAEIVVKSLKF